MQLKSKSIFALIILCSIATQSISAQTLLEVTFNKTSSLVFPTPISAVDRGSRDILAQKVKGVDNVLQIKAGKPHFKETNLTVITMDGELHHFFVRYADAPKAFTIQVTDASKSNQEVIFKQETTLVELERNAKTILQDKRRHSVKATSHHQMKLTLQGIYIQDNTLYFRLSVTNNSNIPFHTDMLRFYVRDKQKVKRTATQEAAEDPIFHKGNSELFRGKASEELVFALPKFTIPDAKVLVIELMEKHGGRHLRLHVKDRAIVKARLVPSAQS